MQKKIALVIGRYDFQGGLENYARNLALALSQAGFAVTILTKGEGLLEKNNPQVVFLKKKGKISLFDLILFNFYLKRYLKKSPHDLVVSMERIFHQDVIRAGFGVHKVFLKQKKRAEPLYKKILTYLNPLHALVLAIEKKAFEDPLLKLLFVNSEMIKKEILENFAVDPKKIFLIRNGVNGDIFKIGSFIPSKRYRFLFVGNGYRRKGLIYLLKALATIDKRDWRLDVVGKDKKIDFYKKETKKMQIDAHVFFHGPQKELSSYYRNADALVLPSIYDPCSNVTLEALFMGLFVIVSSFDGSHELVTPISGLVIKDIFCPIQLKKALESAFNHPKTKESMEKRKETVKELDFTTQLGKMVEKITSLFN